jgi:hypothetical protein
MEKYEPATFDNLNSYPKDQDFLRLVIDTLAGIQESQNPSEQINLVIELRRMRKYNLIFFENIFNNIACHFDRYIRNENLGVTLEALTLCCEIFSYYKYDGPLRAWMFSLVPAVIEQTTCKTSEQVKLTAITAIANLSENMFFPETVETLLDIILESENEYGAINAMNAFIGVVRFIDDENLVNEFGWCSLLSTIEEFCRGSGGNPKRLNYVREILLNVQNKLGDRFEYFLSVCSEYAELCLKIMNSSY